MVDGLYFRLQISYIFIMVGINNSEEFVNELGHLLI
jgi:hypothetical protein